MVDTLTDGVVASLPGLGDYARGLGNFITGCASDAVCNDGNQCTTDTCVNFNCTHTCATGQPCGSGCMALVCQQSGDTCTCAVQ